MFFDKHRQKKQPNIYADTVHGNNQKDDIQGRGEGNRSKRARREPYKQMQLLRQRASRTPRQVHGKTNNTELIQIGKRDNHSRRRKCRVQHNKESDSRSVQQWMRMDRRGCLIPIVLLYNT